MNELRKNYKHQKQNKTKIPKSEARDYFYIMSIHLNRVKKSFMKNVFFIKIGTT